METSNPNNREHESDEEIIGRDVNAKFNKLILYIGGFGFVSAIALCLYLGMSLSYALGLPVIFALVWGIAMAKS